jgi:hypothetical protein
VSAKVLSGAIVRSKPAIAEEAIDFIASFI